MLQSCAFGIFDTWVRDCSGVEDVKLCVDWKASLIPVRPVEDGVLVEGPEYCTLTDGMSLFRSGILSFTLRMMMSNLFGMLSQRHALRL